LSKLPANNCHQARQTAVSMFLYLSNTIALIGQIIFELHVSFETNLCSRDVSLYLDIQRFRFYYIFIFCFIKLISNIIS